MCTRQQLPDWYKSCVTCGTTLARIRFVLDTNNLERVRHSMRVIFCIIAALLAAAAGPAHAQAWPNKTITLVAPFPPGGGTDAFARPLSVLQLAKQLGRPVIIDNRGGAGGTVGASIAAKQPPDGYRFFIGAVHHAFATFVASEIQRWGQVTQASGAKLD